jgi:hypothetical protein
VKQVQKAFLSVVGPRQDRSEEAAGINSASVDAKLDGEPFETYPI